MPIARSSGVLLGTDETTGITIATTATTTSSETDMLGGDAASGEADFFIKFTSTVTAGTVDVTLYPSRIAGQAYSDVPPLIASYAPINGTQKIFLGRFPIDRYMTGAVKNNATGANITNVTLGYSKFVYS